MIQNSVRLTEIDPNTVRPGWVALLIVLALAVATFLLWRNMGKQMKKINFDQPGDPAAPKDRDDQSEGTDERPGTGGDKD